MDVGDEAVNAGIDAGRCHPMQIAVRGVQIGEHLQIRHPARIGLVGRITADALKVIALRVVFPGLVQAGSVELRMLRDKPSRNAGK